MSRVSRAVALVALVWAALALPTALEGMGESPARTDAAALGARPAEPRPAIATVESSTALPAAWSRLRGVDGGSGGAVAATVAVTVALVLFAALVRRRPVPLLSGAGPAGRPPNRSPPLRPVV